MENIYFISNDGSVYGNVDGDKLSEQDQTSTISSDENIDSSSLSDAESSIQKQVETINLMFSNQDLDMAKCDIESLSEELKRAKVQISEVQSQLKEKDADIARVMLERDLANAETNITKQQYNRCKDALLLEEKKDSDDPCADFQHVTIHQFTPGINRCEDWCVRSELPNDDISRRLMDGKNSQDEVKRLVVNWLRERQEPDDQPGKNRNGKFRSILTCIFRQDNGSKRKWRVFNILSIRKRWKESKSISKLKYVAVHDSETVIGDEDSIIECTDPICNSDAHVGEGNESWLFDEILANAESNLKCIDEANQHINLQARKINSLQREINNLITSQMIAVSTSFSEDEQSLQDSSDVFSGIDLSFMP